MDPGRCTEGCKDDIQLGSLGVSLGVFVVMVIMIMVICFGWQYYRKQRGSIQSTLKDKGKMTVMCVGLHEQKNIGRQNVLHKNLVFVYFIIEGQFQLGSVSTNTSTLNILRNNAIDISHPLPMLPLPVLQESATNICHPKLISDFKNEPAVYPDTDEFDQLNEIDFCRHITRLSHTIGDEFTMSKSGNMNR